MFRDTDDGATNVAAPEPQPQQDDPRTEPYIEEAQAKPVEDNAAMNLRRLREKTERLERERDDALRRARELESQHAKATPASEEEDDFKIDENALMEGKDLKRVAREIKKLKGEINQYRQQSSMESTEARLKSQYTDFDRVVSKENVEALRESYPEIAASISANPDIYGRAVSAYTLIKKMGIYTDNPQYEADRLVAQRNAAKPKPTASISPQQGDTPLSRANAFASGKVTKELQQQLYQEMVESMKNR